METPGDVPCGSTSSANAHDEGRAVTVESLAKETASATSAGRYMATTRAKQTSSDRGGPLRGGRRWWVIGRHQDRKQGCVQRRGPSIGVELVTTGFWTQATAAQRSRRPSARGAPKIGKFPRRIKNLLHIGGSRGQGNHGALAESLERICGGAGIGVEEESTEKLDVDVCSCFEKKLCRAMINAERRMEPVWRDEQVQVLGAAKPNLRNKFHVVHPRVRGITHETKFHREPYLKRKSWL